jgi:hypothetical protein
MTGVIIESLVRGKIEVGLPTPAEVAEGIPPDAWGIYANYQFNEAILETLVGEGKLPSLQAGKGSSLNKNGIHHFG